MVDKHNMDSTFATIWLFDSDYSMAVELLGECHSDMCGANGMLSAFTSNMEGIGTDILLKTKMVGLTTDGENTNTGKTAACGL